MKIVKFIKQEKREEGLIDANKQLPFEHGKDNDIVEAILPLEDYATAFKHDSPSHIQVQIKKM
jgi:hypothetical protein